MNFDEINFRFNKKRFDKDAFSKGINDYLSSSDFEKDFSYWKNQFGTGESLKFYNIKSNVYKSQKVLIDFDALNVPNRFNFMAAIFSLYLSRIDNSKGCLLKTLISTETNDLGPFDRFTLLKFDNMSDITFKDHLTNVDKVYDEAVEHTKISVENYLGDLSFYSIYDFTEYGDMGISNSEGSALTLNVFNDCIELVYNSDLFSDVYIEHMLENIRSLIENLAESADQLICEINILSDKEESLFDAFSKGKEVDVDKSNVLSKAFRQNAMENPDAIAVDDGVYQISYGDLEKSSNSIAHDLSERYGIGLGDSVALMLPRTYHFPELVLALNKIGSFYIPIDLLVPVKRIEHMLNISEAKFIVTTKEIASRYDFDCNVICLEDLNRDEDADVEIVATSDDLLAVMFTSGTTGLPKGVMISNGQMPGQVISLKELFDFSKGDVLGCYLSFSFVASFVMYGSFYWGACCRIFNEREQKDSLLLIKELKEKPMNSLILPPTVGVPIFENEDIKVDYLVLAGAKLNELSKRDRHTQLINFYGTSETIITTTKKYDLNNVDDDHVTVGKPISNIWIYILDENGNKMPIGVPGELCISSSYISPGYYNDDELNNKVFVDNPYSDCEDNKIMYRSGDIGLYNFDGEIEIIGRKDDQLSVRGFRIESNEILSIMDSFPEISQVYLDVEYDSLIAYYTTNEDLDIIKVKDALKNELPYYMVPSLFVELDKIHLNPNGKIDKVLMKREFNKSAIDIEDEVLSIVVDGFKEILNRDSVLIDDNFVALGGSSLSAMKLQGLLKEKLDVSLSSSEIIELATPIKISNHIKFDLDLQKSFEIRYSFDDLCPLSESQLNVYLDETSHELGTTYNNPFKLIFNKKYSVDSVKKIINKYLEAYPITLARVVQEGEDILLSFDSNVEIDVVSGGVVSGGVVSGGVGSGGVVSGGVVSGGVGSNVEIDEISDDGLSSQLEIERNFVRPFDLNENLARFLILETEESLFLYIDLHHLIFDANSLNVLINNFNSILDEESEFEVDDGFLRQLSFEENILETNYADEAENFFDAMLADCDEVSDLMASVNSDGKGNIGSVLDIDNDKLTDFIQSQSITHNQFFSSVFAYALSRFTGASKVLFNLLEDGRGHIDLSNSVGMFVRTLPLLMDCRNQSVSSFLRYSANLVNSAMKNDMYPFRILANKYDLDSNILFQYLPEISQTGDIFSIEELEHDESSDLLFYIYHCDDGEYGIRVFYSDKFSVDFIRSFIEVFNIIVLEIMDADFLSDIEYVSKEDLEFMDSFNQTEKHIDYDDILDAFNDNLSKNPDNVLVSFKDSSYSYAEGAFIASQIANKLKDLDVSSGECISFLLSRSEWYLLSILGILANGDIFVPLDHHLPNERLSFMVEDTSSKLVIVDDDNYGRAKELFGDLTLLNVSDINIAGKNDNANEIAKLRELPYNYDDLACILYTSGTTGLPKGVKNTRKSILNVCAFYKDKYDLDENDVYGLFSAIGFDVTIFVINVVLYSGACLSVVPEEIRLDMHRMNEYFKGQNVSHAFITTQVAKLFMNSVDCDYLDLLLVIGEKLGEVESPENYALVDAYGPTEAFAFVTAIENNEKIDYSSVGLMDYNMKSYVLDDELRRVPIGAVGELYLSGHQLADGYMNRPEKTAELFVHNPFNEGSDDSFYESGYCMMYRTGDMVRLLPDGTIGFIGRRDTQVKIRGNRLELGEVEAVIRQLDYVEDLSVQTIRNGENNELVAYLVCDEKHNEDIKEFISQNKPDYMVPSHIINLDKIPLNANGKVDKKVLMEIGFSNSKTEYISPRTDVEKDIVNAFEKAFNMSKISLLDDFTNLGGDSLIAIKLISYLKNYNVSSADIMSLRSPKAIADNITEDSFELDIYSLETGCPLTETQLNIYLDVMAKKEVDSYFIPFIIDVSKEYSKDEMVNVLNILFAMHPICSMCVSDDYDVPHLIKSRTPTIAFKSNANDVEIYKFLADPFDLHDSLCRFLIVENDDGYALFSVFHHLIFDERSIHVFRRDFNHILNGGAVNLDSSFKDESIDSKDYFNEGVIDLDANFLKKPIEFDDSFLKVSAFNDQVKNTEQYNDACEFYDSILSDTEGIGLFLDDVLPDGPGFASCNLDFDNGLFEEFLNKNSVSEYVVFTGAFAYALSRFTGSDKVLFAIDDHGRDRFSNFDSIGMFVNTLPLLVDAKDMEISMFVENMSNLIYNVLRYNYYPYRDLTIQYGMDIQILFQFFPIWLNKEDSFYNVDNKIINNIADFNMDLMINVNQKTDGYTLNVQYSSKYSKSTIRRFMETYNLILSQMISVESLSDIVYVSSSDLDLLNSFNETEMEIKYDDILDAFNDNLAKSPDNNLVSYNDISYTYAEGAFIASGIRNKLKELGVSSGDCVSFLLDRSEWYLFSILGILSNGSIFVPLDYYLPDERLRFMVEDTSSKIIIVDDSTFERAKELFGDLTLLNVSEINIYDDSNEIGDLSQLTADYNDLACILYTSGTTGLPKGVKNTRKSILNVCAFYKDKYDLDENDVYGLFSAIGFDVTIFVINVVLYSGACLSVVPEEIRLDMHRMNEYFKGQNVSHAFITTQVAKLFMNSVDCDYLDLLLVIGEKLGEVESPENYALVDAYGPTEAFAFVTAIENNEKIDYSSVGLMDYNMKSYVLDDELRRVPIGAVGELYLSGHQLADGYLNRDEETANAFLDNPFYEGDGYNIMYRTGDMVRILPDGTVGIIERRDGQVKIRGNRVELGEVESVIRELTFVKDVTVQAIKNGDNYELVAYLVYDENLPVVKSVQDHINERKPPYMIPSHVVVLDEIPLNVNGKVDKKALPKVELESLQADYVPPTTETEKIVVDSFKAVFNQEKIGIYDDFIQLGGDSLTAIKVTSILLKNDIVFNARGILNERTPYRIAKIIDYAGCDNSCTLIKRGLKDQNMFLIPPMTGFSFEYSNLVHSFDFEGNVYAIDDPKFKLSLDEIKELDNHSQYTLDKFHEAVKDIFNDGDILVGYSSGGIFALMLAEKLEKEGKNAKCILLDGLLSFREVFYTREKLYKEALEHWRHHEFDFIVGTDRKGAKFDKFIEITLQNVNIDFDEPSLSSPIIYLSTGELYDEDIIQAKIDSLSSADNEVILIDSNHNDILKVDYYKLVPYF